MYSFFLKCSDYVSVNLLIILLSRSFTFFSHSFSNKENVVVCVLFIFNSICFTNVEPFSG